MRFSLFYFSKKLKTVSQRQKWWEQNLRWRCAGGSECVCVCNCIWLTLVGFISGPRPAGWGWIRRPGATNLSWTRSSLIKPCWTHHYMSVNTHTHTLYEGWKCTKNTFHRTSTNTSNFCITSFSLGEVFCFFLFKICQLMVLNVGWGGQEEPHAYRDIWLVRFLTWIVFTTKKKKVKKGTEQERLFPQIQWLNNSWIEI